MVVNSNINLQNCRLWGRKVFDVTISIRMNKFKDPGEKELGLWLS